MKNAKGCFGSDVVERGIRSHMTQLDTRRWWWRVTSWARHEALLQAVLPVGRFSRTIGLFFFRWVAGNFLLLQVAVFVLVLSKFMRFYGLFLLNNCSIIEYSVCRFCWGSENCFDLKQSHAVFLDPFCSLDVRTNEPSVEITWSFLCDRMGNNVDRILTGRRGGLQWSHHTRGGSSQEVQGGGDFSNIW